jgi:hypothetical protein
MRRQDTAGDEMETIREAKNRAETERMSVELSRKESDKRREDELKLDEKRNSIAWQVYELE